MHESIKFAREIAKKCFRVNEPDDGSVIFDVKLCAKMLKEKNTSHNSARAEICPWCNGEGLRMSHCGGPMKCRVCEGTGKLSPVA